MSKRGQITIFIIIAIIFIASLALYFIFKGGLRDEIISPESEEIYLFVQACIYETGKDAIYDIGQSGGYFVASEPSTDSGIPYYYLINKSYMPSKQRIEREISYYINTLLFFCTEDFVDFPEFEISEREIKADTQIQDNKIILNVEYPINIRKGESITRLRDFENIEIPVRLGVIYNAISEIIRDQLTREDICLSCISEIAVENDLKIDIVSLENGAIMFTIKDENSLINGMVLEFKFVNKYG